MPYEKHYDEPFLDGLHNYLPEILYGQPEQFGSAAPLVTYIQRSIRNEMDLFSSARRAFTNTRITPMYQNIPQQPAPSPIRRSVPRNIDISLVESLISPISNTTFMNTLLGLYTIPSVAAMPMEPVIVHPTVEQVEAGTQLEIVDAENEICTICQDAIQTGSQARAFRVCDHRFHDGCINTWFQRSVHCPTCRHDVRVLS